MPPLMAARKSQRNAWSLPTRPSLLLACLLVVVITPLFLFSSIWDESDESTERVYQSKQRSSVRGKGLALPKLKPKSDTLVLYIFSNTDGEYENNLRFFLRHGVEAGDGCDYVVIIQTGGTSKELGSPLPEMPPNVRFVNHSNECYDWGTMGWLLSSKLVNPALYQYFIFMNSSVRGPFIPPYLWGKVRWQDLLISRLSDKIKLVGPTISCEGSPKDGDVHSEWRINPHVQSYVVATDKTGLNLMVEDGTVFGCYKSMWDVIFYSELGSSWSILAAGYSIDALMLRYQGVDWTNLSTWDCNARVNPYGEYYYDGITIDPFEVMFVKVKDLLLERRWSYALHASKYDAWMAEQATTKAVDVVSNVWRSDPGRLKSYKIGYMRYFGSACFDTEHYRLNNWDQKNVTDANQLWEHWVTNGADPPFVRDADSAPLVPWDASSDSPSAAGQFEARPHRFTCDPIAE